MSASEDLINFDVIETQKENIQSLPGGRSAKALAQIFSSGSNGDKYASPSPNETRTLNDAIRQEYEAEIQASADSDDPLDVFDRYVKWTMNAYPSTQATAESGLLSLLERATKAFLNSTHYKNDPRYLRLWLQYVRLFSDAPRETFAFLSRHNIGQGLALFYEEFAAWLEGAGRWAQAEEVYKLGLEREARPQERLLRKFGEFQTRFEQQPRGSDGPSSPALPTVRAALAAKVDPFATARTTPADPQAPQSRGVGGTTTKKSGKPKMAIFADTDEPSSQPAVSGQSAGWDSIQSIRDRRKENTVEAKPWVGETMRSEKPRAPVQKMAIFRDESNRNTPDDSNIPRAQKHTPEHHIREAINPRTGRRERVFVDLEAVYPDYKDPSHEICLEELRASHRGWLKKDWSKPSKALQEIPTNAAGRPDTNNENIEPDLTDELKQKLTTEGKSSHHGDREGKMSKVKKIKVREINETQTIKTNLDSPAKPKIKRKNVREPTMTFHTRAATDEIYSIFNQPLKSETAGGDHGDSLFDSEFEDDDYTSGGESTATGRMSAGTSEFGDDDTSNLQRGNEDDNEDEEEDEDVENDGEWTEFTSSRLVPLPSETPRADEDEDSVRHRYIPEMPDNYNPPVGMYRDAAIMAQNRLPFMTPIIEKTESSLPSFTAAKGRLYDTKTPCKTVPEVDYTPSGSPVGDLLLPTPDAGKTIPPLPEIQSPSPAVKTLRRTPVKKSSSPKPADFAAIIKEEQCDPTDIGIRKTILKSAEPPLTTYAGYHDNSSVFGAHAGDIQKYSKALKRPAKSGDRSSFTSPVLEFPNANRAYAVRRELGAGAYAPVYLAETIECSDDANESHQRQGLEAIKMETDPPNAWEFYMIRTAQDRIAATPSLSRAADSIVRAHELHLFKDESFLIEDYRGQGTLLDLVNIIRTEAMTTTGNAEAGMDEALSMFFAVELFRTIEALHSCGILHGDVKPDNCLVRFDSTKNHSSSTSSLPSPPSESLLDLTDDDDTSTNPSETHYSARGQCGWRDKGLMLIDFGRGVDMKAFRPDVKFIAEWEMSQHDCIEVREMRPWTYQIDLYGVAVTIHAMLFGKYLECVPVDPRTSSGGGSRDSFNNATADDDGGDNLSKRYRVRESFKRYWDREIWTDVFDLLLNPCSQRWTKMERHQQQENTSSDNTPTAASPLPVLHSMKHVREKMEAWLTANAEKKGLSQQIRKLEAHLSRRKERLERDR